jgi:hypothetical protein
MIDKQQGQQQQQLLLLLLVMRRRLAPALMVRPRTARPASVGEELPTAAAQHIHQQTPGACMHATQRREGRLGASAKAICRSSWPHCNYCDRVLLQTHGQDDGLVRCR